MDEELKIVLSQLVSREPILPNLRHNHSPQKNASNEPGSSDESDDNYSNGEFDNEVPRKKKPRRPSYLSPVSENGNGCKYNGMRSRQLRLLLRSDKVIEFCQDNGLIARKVICSCGNPMRLVNKRSSDGCGWMCYEKVHESRPDQTIRKGTWFECSKLGISDILWIAYMWVYEYSCMSMLHECDHSNRTVIGWCTCCQGFCEEIIQFKNEPLGGDGKTVEVFERKVSDKHWILCAVEYDSTKTLHVVIDENNPSTLLQIFDRYFLPRTKVVANNWSFFKDLSLEDFTYLTTEKCISFFDLVQKDSMIEFEAFITRINRALIQDEWSTLEHGPSFYEKMYRKSLAFAPDAFFAFLKDISLIYKPLDRLQENKN